jgi:hypothetical protein
MLFNAGIGGCERVGTQLRNIVDGLEKVRYYLVNILILVMHSCTNFNFSEGLLVVQRFMT